MTTSSKSLVTVRMNKNFTGIYLLEISVNAFIESRKKYDELKKIGHKYVVIRINKKTYADFFEQHSLSFSDINDTSSISFLGTSFKIYKDTKNGLKKVGYYKRNYNDTTLCEQLEREWEECFMSGNVARSFLETSYQNTTGIMLFA